MSAKSLTDFKTTMTNNKIWTLESYSIYNDALRAADQRFQAERDRRYGEVNVEREKALKIKETADLAALELARESQVYKDERNDAMREQTLASTGIYATHADVAMVAEKMGKSIADVAERMETALTPLANFVANQQGVTKGSQVTIGKIYAAIGAVTAIIVAAVYLFHL